MVDLRQQKARVVLALGTATTFHREIIAGVGAYLREHRLDWQLRLASEGSDGLSDDFDGLIADIDRLDTTNLSRSGCSIVGISSAIRVVPQDWPEDIPLVGSDNIAMIELALDHLRDIGIRQFAFFSPSKYAAQAWATMRLNAFISQTQSGPIPASVFKAASDRMSPQEAMQSWVGNLPSRTGIVAVNDSAARELLYACNTLKRKVPDDLCIVGIDNDPLVDALAPMPISSVVQGSREIGRKAAELLHCGMTNGVSPNQRVGVLPAGLELAKTSRHTRSASMLRKAMTYIASHAAQGIKAEQVANHLGVSRSALERCFETELGRTVHDELLQTRIALAKRMLRTQHVSIAEVAVRCGFRTQQYMHVVFKRELGCTPGEFVAGLRNPAN